MVLLGDHWTCYPTRDLKPIVCFVLEVLSKVCTLYPLMLPKLPVLAAACLAENADEHTAEHAADLATGQKAGLGKT